MRFAIVLLTVLGILVGSASLPTVSTIVAAQQSVAAAQQSSQPQVDVDINRGGGAWWTSPIWIAIGVIALLVVILLVILAARGGGTTVIKE